MSMAVNTFNYLCIGCPLGCHLEVDEEESDKKIVEIRGFSCKRGKEYAAEEHVDPRRMVTTSVRVINGVWAKLPVKSTRSIPKGRVMEFCEELRKLKIQAPIKRGDLVSANVLGLGVDVVASRDMPLFY